MSLLLSRKPLTLTWKPRLVSNLIGENPPLDYLYIFLLQDTKNEKSFKRDFVPCLDSWGHEYQFVSYWALGVEDKG